MAPKAVKVDYRIKLLSGNNVVMVEATGYESEIFMPIIINGRIGFQNIIPNRRCCTSQGNQYNKNNSNVRCLPQFTPLKDMNTRTYTPLTSIPSPPKPTRISGGRDVRLAPLAYSTPMAAGTATAEGTQSKNLVKRNKQRRPPLSVSKSICKTPEPPRRDVQSVYNQQKDTLVQIPSGIKVIRLYRDPTPTYPQTKNVLRVVGTKNDSFVQCSQNIDMLQSPQTPIPTQNENELKALNVLRVSEFRLPPTPDLGIRSKHKQGTPSSILRSVTKWRKCITPIRTYSVRRNIQLQSSLSNVKKKSLNTSTARKRHRVIPSVRLDGKIVPSYMINPTAAPKTDVHVEVKKRKVVIDSKLKITPRTFKKQQHDTSDLQNDSKFRLPTNRKEYEIARLSAFDMLTNSNRMRNLSLKLNNQFRRCCVNKASSTNPRYKQLCSIPPLQQDQQVRDIQNRQSHVNPELNVVESRRFKVPETIAAIK